MGAPSSAGLLGSVAGATPWGAGIGAVAGIATAAIQSDAVPVTSGGGQTQIGGMTIGSKTVGSGSTGGTSTAQSAAQNPPQEYAPATPSALATLPPWAPYAAAALMAALVLIVALKRKG